MKRIISCSSRKNFCSFSIQNWKEKTRNAPRDLRIEHSVKCFRLKEEDMWMFDVELTPQSQNEYKTPVAISCSLDRSSSMGEYLMSTSKHANGETATFTRLDLVKHCMRTVVQSLTDEDYLGFNAFSTNAIESQPMIRMTDSNKNIALEALESLTPGGSTNLWGGIRMSHDNLDFLNFDGNTYSLVLTDGEPNINPARGVMYEFSKLKPRFDNKYQFDSFGLNGGYQGSFDPYLLLDLAQLHGGNFHYISDFSTCGSIFVNYMANVLTTAKQNMMLELKSQVNLEYKGKIGNIGSLHFGRTRNLIFKAKIPKIKDFSMVLGIHNKDIFLNQNCVEVPVPTQSMTKQFLLDIIDKVINTGFNLESNKASLDFLSRYIDSSHFLYNDIYHDNIHKGQIGKALLSSEYYESWGKPYLMYFKRSHELSVCSNFKDESLQSYGGKLFQNVRSDIETIFQKIPPPKPNSKQMSIGIIASFYNPSGPCIDGNGQTIMADNTNKLIKDLVKGDQIKTKHGEATIKCIIVTNIKGGECLMSNFDGMLITPYHPIYKSSKWQFPNDVQKSIKTKCDKIYSFVLDKHHIMTVNGNDIITLGHGIKDGILDHEFFGTTKVIDCLKQKKGWEAGLIQLDEYKPTYDSNNMICWF